MVSALLPPMPRPPMANESPMPLNRLVDLIPCNGQCINLWEAWKSCLLIMQLPHDLFPCFGVSHDIENHFPIGQTSFNYSNSDTLNSWVLLRCVTEYLSELDDICSQINYLKHFNMYHKSRYYNSPSLKERNVPVTPEDVNSCVCKRTQDSTCVWVHL